MRTREQILQLLTDLNRARLPKFATGGLITGPSPTDDSVPVFISQGHDYSIARTLNATATDDGITIEMQCGATILTAYLSPDEWDDFRAEGDEARDAFIAGLEDPDALHDWIVDC